MLRIPGGEAAGGRGAGPGLQHARQGRGQPFAPPGSRARPAPKRTVARALSSCSSTSGSCRIGFPARSVKTVLPCVPLRTARSHSAAARQRSSRPAWKQSAGEACCRANSAVMPSMWTTVRQPAWPQEGEQPRQARESASGRRRPSCRCRRARPAVLRPPASRDRGSGQRPRWG